MPRGNNKKAGNSAQKTMMNVLASMEAKHGLRDTSNDMEHGIVDVITFCEDPRYLNLPGGNFKLYMSQKIVLKAFYMGTTGNKNLRLTQEEWQWLYDRKDVFETQTIIDKVKKAEVGDNKKFRELILVLGRRSSKTVLASVIEIGRAHV